MYGTLGNGEMAAWKVIFTAQMLKSKEIKRNELQKVEAYRKDKKETCHGEIADSIPTRKKCWESNYREIQVLADSRTVKGKS